MPVPPSASPVASSSSVSWKASALGVRSAKSVAASWHQYTKPVEAQAFETSASASMAVT